MREIKFRTWDKLKQVFVKGSLAFEYDDFEWVVLDCNNYEIGGSWFKGPEQYGVYLENQIWSIGLRNGLMLYRILIA